jgi:hypothetical protein
MDLTHPVQATGIEEDALRSGRFARIDVCGDTKVADLLERVLPCHVFPSSFPA